MALVDRPSDFHSAARGSCQKSFIRPRHRPVLYTLSLGCGMGQVNSEWHPPPVNPGEANPTLRTWAYSWQGGGVEEAADAGVVPASARSVKPRWVREMGEQLVCGTSS